METTQSRFAVLARPRVIIPVVIVGAVLVAVLARPLGLAKPDYQADLNGDGIVDIRDLSAVVGDWGKAGTPADIVKDGRVNVLDVSALLSVWSDASAVAATPAP